MNNMNTARKILGLLGCKKNEPGILLGLMSACAEIHKYGPPEGQPCMALRLALDCGCEYTPPQWCKDIPLNPQ